MTVKELIQALQSMISQGYPENEEILHLDGDNCGMEYYAPVTRVEIIKADDYCALSDEIGKLAIS